MNDVIVSAAKQANRVNRHFGASEARLCDPTGCTDVSKSDNACIKNGRIRNTRINSLL